MALPTARVLLTLILTQVCYSSWFLALRQADLRLNNNIYRYLLDHRLSLDLLGFLKAFQCKGGGLSQEAPAGGKMAEGARMCLRAVLRMCSYLIWGLMAVIPLYLAGAVWAGLRRGSPRERTPLSIELPKSHLGLVFSCFVASAAIHELFHALAMWVCGEPVGEFGFGVRLLIPTFFVRSRRPLREIPLSKRRAILAAGPIGNFCLSGALLLLLWIIYLVVIGSLCTKGVGITVLSFPGSDSLRQDEGGTSCSTTQIGNPADVDAQLQAIVNLFPGDVIEAVEDCPVASLDDYRLCVTDLSRSSLFREPVVYDFDHSVIHKLSLLGRMARIDRGEPKRLGHGGVRVDVDEAGYNLIYPGPLLDGELSFSFSGRPGRELSRPQQLLASEPYVPVQQRFLRVLQPVKLKRDSRALAGAIIYGKYPTFEEVSRKFCLRTSENDDEEGSCFFPQSLSLQGYLQAMTQSVPEGDEANAPFANEALDPEDLRFYLAVRVNGEYRIIETSLRALWGLVASPYVIRNKGDNLFARLAGLGVDLPGLIDLIFATFVQASLAMGVFALLPFPRSSDGAQLLQTLEGQIGMEEARTQEAGGGESKRGVAEASANSVPVNALACREPAGGETGTESRSGGESEGKGDSNSNKGSEDNKSTNTNTNTNATAGKTLLCLPKGSSVAHFHISEPVRVMLLYSYTGLVAILFAAAVLVSLS